MISENGAKLPRLPGFAARAASGRSGETRKGGGVARKAGISLSGIDSPAELGEEQLAGAIISRPEIKFVLKGVFLPVPPDIRVKAGDHVRL